MDAAYIELQKYAGGAWTTRGTLALTGRIADTAPDSGLRFEGTVASVWVSDPASSLPSMGNYDAWGSASAWGTPARANTAIASG